MVEFTEHHLKSIEETHDAVIRIETALVGLPGEEDGGLCGKVTKLSKRQNNTEGKQKTLIGILIGSGILTGGAVAGLTKLLGG